MSFLDDLSAARDACAAEFRAEMQRRAALVAAGDPAPTTVSFDGRSVDPNAYVSLMTARLKELNDAVIAMGGDGGFADVVIHGY